MNATTISSNRKSAFPTKGRRKTHRTGALSTAALGCILAASVHVEAFPAMVPPASVLRPCESESVHFCALPGARFSRSYLGFPKTRNGDSDRPAERTALRYCNGNEEDSSERLKQHVDATASIASASASASPVRAGNRISSMWDAIISKKRQKFTRQGRSEREQFLVDDYLEFVDRRYNRLHEDEMKKDVPKQEGKGINTAWNWLMQGDTQSDAERQRQEDALEVLGLAELASVELLRKHHLPIPEENDVDMDPSVTNGSTSAVIIDATVVPDGEKDFVPSSGRVATVSNAAIVSHLAASAASLKRAHERKLAIVALAVRAAFYNTINSAIRSVKTAIEKVVPTTAALFAMGGGSKALKASTAVALALMIVLRPLSHMVIKNIQS